MLPQTNRLSINLQTLVRLQVDIHYEPSLSPPPASFLRQQAYLQGGFLLPPSEDPTGWHTLPTQSISRSVGNAQANLTMTVGGF